MSQNKNLKGNHDIFISYRRENGVDLASRIKKYLEIKGYSVFMDIEDLKSGPFTRELYDKIENSKDFLIVLTKNSLDRCNNPDDWLRIEIAHAIRHQKNVVPIMAKGFTMPAKSELPDEIKMLHDFNGLTPHSDLFEQSMERLIKVFLVSNHEGKFRRFLKRNQRHIKLFFIFMITIIIFSYNHKLQEFYDFINLSFININNVKYRYSDLKQAQWFMKTTQGPFYRRDFSMTYDPLNGHTILHGGFGTAPSHKWVQIGPRTLSDTWVWDDSVWKKKTDGMVLFKSVMVFDYNLGNILMFGGSSGSIVGKDNTSVWSGEDWKTLDVKGPEGRYQHDMVFDMARQSVLLFGGFYGRTDVYGKLIFRNLGDTWEWNGINWERIDVKGPEPRKQHKMVFDIKNMRVVLFGGTDDSRIFNDTWIWDGTKALWSKVETLHSPIARCQHGMVYDASNERIILFGGKTEGNIALNDLWEWDGIDWKLIDQNAPPEPRFGHGMVYDSERKKIIIHGGSNENHKFRDTWELKFE